MSDSEISETKKSLDRVKDFDPNSVVRKVELGANSFETAVQPIERLVSLFRKLPMEMLDEIPLTRLREVRQASDAAFSVFNEALSFDTDPGNNRQRQDEIVEKIRKSYDSSWNAIQQYISYGVARTVDFSTLEMKGRAAIQTIDDIKKDLLKEIGDVKDEAEAVLRDTRQLAEEQGVTQLAIYFREEASEHNKESNWWFWATLASFILTLFYACISLFFPQFALLVATDLPSAIQLAVSKILIFAVLGYATFQCARNFIAHKHNKTVNRHRQNALLTFKTLADAGQSPEARDVVLSHAAAAIYAPVDTGFLRAEERGYESGSSTLSFSARNPIGGGAGE